MINDTFREFLGDKKKLFETAKVYLFTPKAFKNAKKYRVTITYTFLYKN